MMKTKGEAEEGFDRKKNVNHKNAKRKVLSRLRTYKGGEGFD